MADDFAAWGGLAIVDVVKSTTLNEVNLSDIMPKQTQPSTQNDYLVEHATLLFRCYADLLGRELIDETQDDVERARLLFEAPFFVASHNTAADPILTYGNRCALDLFEMSWDEFTSTPSRLTAEAPNRAERAELLRRGSADSFINDYSGVRISRHGQRFRIRRATVWNLTNSSGIFVGQAATFSAWQKL